MSDYGSTSQHNGIHDCPHCGKPCHVVNGRYPQHDCTRKDV